MPISQEEAKAWSFRNSKFLALRDGESFKAKLKDSKAVTSRFDAEKEVIRYTFEFPDGTTKFWENGSGANLEILSALYNKVVEITRSGTGNATKYEIMENV